MEKRDKTKDALIKQIKLQEKRIKDLKKLDRAQQQQQQQQMLRVNEARLRTIIEKNPDGMIVVDKDGIVLFFNEAAMFLFKIRKEQLLGHSFGISVNLDDVQEVDIFRTGKEFGESGVAEMQTVEIEWDEKPAYLLMFHDITDIKKSEQLKCEIEEQKGMNKLKDEFISTVSHELRTPLSMIKEGVTLVLDKTAGGLNNKQEQMLGIASENIDRLVRIVSDILDVSKIEAGKVELKRVLVDVSGIVRDACNRWMLESKKKQQVIKFSLAETPVNVYVDPDKIIQILNNLISNAIRYTPEKGKIGVELVDRRDEIEISVSDNGIGIAKEDLHKVFGKFQQFSRTAGQGAKGTGLGLAICKQLVEIHQGAIKVETKASKGTRFSFSLPKIKAEEVFKEYINNGIKESADRNSPLSLVIIHIARFDELQKELGYEKAHNLLKDIERLTKGSLRRRADTVVRNSGELIVLLFDTRKEDVGVVKKRVEETINTYISQGKEKWFKGLYITIGNATYPEQAGNDQELLSKARDICCKKKRGGGRNNDK